MKIPDSRRSGTNAWNIVGNYLLAGMLAADLAQLVSDLCTYVSTLTMRNVELDTLLNLDGRSRSQPESVVAKSTRPSVLEGLKRPMPPRNPEKKSKQHEEVR